MQHAVILAGGSGVRFWPLSRRNRPKQFLPLGGSVSLLRATFERLLPMIPAERIWIVTARSQVRAVAKELPEVARPRILGEPRARNTAPAIAWAVQEVLRVDSGANLLIVPADAWVPSPGRYRAAVRRALALSASEDRLVLVGVRPTRDETGYGYIEPGAKLGRGPGREVRRFVEKPSVARARRFVREGYLWNCGIFAWRGTVFQEAVRECLPRLSRALAPLAQGRVTIRALERVYGAAPSISVDHGVLERAKNLAVVPAAFRWDDLGSWRALERLGENGGFRAGHVVARESPGLIAWAEGGVVSVLGVPDVVVVHTPDATLVVAKERAQEVKDLVADLERTKAGRKLVEG
jgi:mannose-1-phosphate guanylyltransferase